MSMLSKVSHMIQNMNKTCKHLHVSVMSKRVIVDHTLPSDKWTVCFVEPVQLAKWFISVHKWFETYYFIQIIMTWNLKAQQFQNGKVLRHRLIMLSWALSSHNARLTRFGFRNFLIRSISSGRRSVSIMAIQHKVYLWLYANKRGFRIRKQEFRNLLTTLKEEPNV